MTELEQLATNLETKITLEWYTRTERIYPQLLEALTTAYTLGRHDAYNGQRTAARENGKRGGRPKGSKDKSGQPRTRRSKAKIAQEVKP